MKFPAAILIPFTILNLIPTISAQISVVTLPECGRSCFTGTLQIQDCDGVVSCACANQYFTNTVIACFRFSCNTSEEIESAIEGTKKQCKNVGVELFIQAPIDVRPVTQVGGPVKTNSGVPILPPTTGLPSNPSSSTNTTPSSLSTSTTSTSTTSTTPSNTPDAPNNEGVAENATSSGEPKSSSSGSNKLAIGLGVALGTVFLIALVLGFFLLKRRRRKRVAKKDEKRVELDAQQRASELAAQEKHALPGGLYEVDGSVGSVGRPVELQGNNVMHELQGSDRFKR